MPAIISQPDVQKKLEILSSDAKYDLACACGSSKDEHRKRGLGGRWIYPVVLPNGGSTVLFKTLISNVCSNDCKYCPLREEKDLRRVSLAPEEMAKAFIDHYNRKKVFGLFLSSGVTGSPDSAMARLNATAAILRKKHCFRGYIHLKIIPGASRPAIEEAVSLSTAVSLNIETPGEKNMARLSGKKRFIEDIVESMKFISRLTGKGGRYERVKQTTQFIVGAAGEKDEEIVKYMHGMYERLNMHRVYFSAYQKDPLSPLWERAGVRGTADPFMREHRLYQVDFLLRKYGFDMRDIVFDDTGNLSLSRDPKEMWAERHPEIFPVDINTAPKELLLKVPGLGHITVADIIAKRKQTKISGVHQLGRVGQRLSKANRYLVF